MSVEVGVDEVGRGPLAGPVTVGIAWCKKGEDVAEMLPGITDSKKLSQKKREALYRQACVLRSAGVLGFTTKSLPAACIDEHGISSTLRELVRRGCAVVKGEIVHIYLDKGLAAPAKYSQEQIVGGDGKIPLISLASVVAKVERDRYMVRMGKEYPEYGFETHMGYGTKKHIEAIRMHGLSEMHRKSFCSRVVAE